MTDNSEDGDPRISSCRRCDKTVASFDTRQRAVLSAIYDLSFGRGRQYGAKMSRLADAGLGGWNVAGQDVGVAGSARAESVVGQPEGHVGPAGWGA